MSPWTRRSFLQATGALGALWLTGCGDQIPTRTLKLQRLDVLTGRTVSQRDVLVPDEEFEGQASGPGWLFASVNTLFTVGLQQGDVNTVFGPSEGVWTDDAWLVTGERTGAEDYRLCGYPLGTRQPRWTVSLRNATLLGTHDKITYVAHDGGVSAFINSSGQESWKRADLTALNAWKVGPRWLLLSRANDGKVHWLDLASGASQHEQPTNSEGMRVVALGCDSDGRVLALARRVGLFSFPADVSKLSWKLPMSAEINEGEIVLMADGVALVRTAESLQIVDIATGQVLWRPRAAGQIALVGTTLLLGRTRYTLDGKTETTLSGWDLRSGQRRWRRPWPGEPIATAGQGDAFYTLD